jgi:hypothetical protein
VDKLPHRLQEFMPDAKNESLLMIATKQVLAS